MRILCVCVCVCVCVRVCRYKSIVKYKTAFYSFYLPVGLAMHMVSLSFPSEFGNHHCVLTGRHVRCTVTLGRQNHTTGDGRILPNTGIVVCAVCCVGVCVCVCVCSANVLAQDDFIDCFGDPAVTGKVGTDIEENKCSWLVVQALQRVSPSQREMLVVSVERVQQRDNIILIASVTTLCVCVFINTCTVFCEKLHHKMLGVGLHYNYF